MNESSAIIQALLDSTAQANGMMIHVNEYLSHHPIVHEKLKAIEAESLKEAGKLLTRRAAEDLGKLISWASKKLEAAGRPPITPEDLGGIPLSVSEAFIRESKYSEDAELVECWSNLLASYVECARRGSDLKRYHSIVLGQLTAHDAKCIQAIYAVNSSRETSGPGIPELFEWEDATVGEPRGNDLYSGLPISTVHLPAEAFLFKENLRSKMLEMDSPLGEDVLASIANLSRLGLIELSGYMDGGSDPRVIFHTGFGLAFAQAVTSLSSQ